MKQDTIEALAAELAAQGTKGIPSEPWVICSVAAADVKSEWLNEARATGAYMYTRPNGDVVVKYRQSQLRKVPA